METWLKEHEKCCSCAYRGNLEGRVHCDYIGATDHSRGCPGGNKCTQYIKAKTPYSIRRSFEIDTAKAKKTRVPKKTVEPRKTTDYTLMEDLYREGLDDEQIAEKLSCSIHTVKSWRIKKGLHTNKLRMRPISDTKFFELYKQGLNDKEISKELGVYRGKVRQYREAHGLPCNHIHRRAVEGRPIGGEWRRFGSIAEASEMVCDDREAISKCIAGKQKSTHGWEWRRAE